MKIQAPKTRITMHAIALGLLAATASCDAVDEVEESGQALSTSETVDLGGGVTRTIKHDCLHSCARWETIPNETPGKPPKRICRQYRNDCTQYLGSTLYANASDANPFPAADDDPANPGTRQRLGCGPKAAQNVLSYFNINLPISAITPSPIWTLRFDEALITKYFTDNIATLPDPLASGLQQVLDRYAARHYKVTRKSGVSVEGEVFQSLLKGMPTIVLINGGGHFVVVDGYNSAQQMHILDYRGNDRWVYASQLETDIPWYVPGQGALGYNSKTVITIEPL